jgi:hypothetical protein
MLVSAELEPYGARTTSTVPDDRGGGATAGGAVMCVSNAAIIGRHGAAGFGKVGKELVHWYVNPEMEEMEASDGWLPLNPKEGSTKQTKTWRRTLDFAV